MAASNTDKFKKLTNNFSTTLSSAIVGAGDSSFSPASTTNLPTDTGSVFVIDRVNSSGVATPSTREYVIGVVSGGNVTSLVRGVGNSTAQAHSTGAVVEQVVDQNTLNDVMSGILQDHNQSGYHKQLTDTNGNIILNTSPTASAVNYPTAVNNVTGKNPQILAGGSDGNVGVDIVSKGTGISKVDGAAPQKFFALYDFIESGCIWTADAAGSTLLASMSSGVVWIGGKRLTVAAQANHAFPASKDNYIDFTDNGDGTALVTYVAAVANNAASPALTASGLRNAIIVTGATNIANAASINQGQETMVLPIASSVPYAVTDSLGNLICPRDPNRKVLGYRQITSSVGIASSSATLVTGLTVPVIIPTGRKVRITFGGNSLADNNATTVTAGIWDGTVGSGTQLTAEQMVISTAGGAAPHSTQAVTTPTSTSKTYNASLATVIVGTVTANASATAPHFIMVELV